MKTNKTFIQTAFILAFGALAPVTQAAVLNTGDILTIKTQNYPDGQREKIRWLFSYAKDMGWGWADVLAALAMVPWIVKEGLEGIRGESCEDDCVIGEA